MGTFVGDTFICPLRGRNSFLVMGTKSESATTKPRRNPPNRLADKCGWAAGGTTSVQG